MANFDDLRRCDDVLTDGTAEIGKQRTAFFFSPHLFDENFVRIRFFYFTSLEIDDHF